MAVNGGVPSRRQVLGAAPLLLAGAALGGLAAAPVPAPAAVSNWRRAESARFVVFSDGDERSLVDYVRRLETYDGLMRFIQGLPPEGLPPRKLPLYLVADKVAFERLMPGNAERFAGYYSYSIGDVFAVAIRSKEEDHTILHEYAHHFMYQFAPAPYPAWLVEGYADFFGATHIDNSRIEVGRWEEGRAYQLKELKWIPMADVLSKRVSDFGKDRDAIGAFYAQSWLLTHWLITDGFSPKPVRYGALQAYISAVGAGSDPVKEMTTVTGLDMAALEATLRAYIRGPIKYTPITHKGGTPAAVAVTRLSPAADDLLLELQLLRSGGVMPDDYKPTLLATVRREAARFPGDAVADMALARAELQLGDSKVGHAVLDRHLAAFPNDAEALELAGSSLMDEGDELDYDARRAFYVKALPFLGRAYKADPNRYQTFYAIARSGQVIDRRYPSDNSLEALLAAYDIVPQLPDIRIEVARGMMQRNRWKEARELLAPLVNDPHSAQASNLARTLMKQIDDMSAVTPQASS